MKKENIKIKEKLTIFEKIEAIKEISNSYFVKDENQEIEYTPYFGSMATILAFIKYYVEGITFDDNENLYESIVNDENLMSMYYEASSNNVDFIDILKNVETIIEFEKNKILYKSINITSKFDSLSDPLSLVFSTLNKKIEELNLNEIIDNTNHNLKPF